MGGFLGIGGSGAGGDRQAQLNASSNLQNVFNWGIPAGQQQQATAQKNLGTATDYWQKLLQPGRAQATANAAPATNAILDQTDATRNQAGAFGTGRTGGTASLNRTAGMSATKGVDDTVNSSMTQGRTSAAQGLGTAASVGFGNAGSLLGLGTNAELPVLETATKNREDQAAAAAANAQGAGSMIGLLLGMGLG